MHAAQACVKRRHTSYKRHAFKRTMEKQHSITRRELLAAAGLGAAAWVLRPLNGLAAAQLGTATATAAATATQGTGTRPNFIIIFADDLGYADLGCFGAEQIKTPELDRLAAEGTKFTRFYAATVCSPSRAAILTGCYPKRVGINSVLNPKSGRDGVALNPAELSLGRLFKQAGYATACVGKWHLGHHAEVLPTRHGFDSYFGIPYSNDMTPSVLLRDEQVIEQPVKQETLTERYTEEAIKFITTHKDKPFFLYLPHTMPHVPLAVSEKFKGKSAAGLYGDVIETLDWSTGQIVQALRQLGLDKNTYVLFTSDNGPWLIKGNHAGSASPLREGKSTTYEGGVRVPCIVWAPGQVPAGKTCGDLACTMDFYPTMAALAGVTLPADRIMDGKDITPLLKGTPTAQPVRDEFFYYHRGNIEGVQQGKWKLRFLKPGSGAKSARIELFDLDADMGERTNLADQHPDVVARLRARMIEFDADLSKNIRPPKSVAGLPSLVEAGELTGLLITKME